MSRLRRRRAVEVNCEFHDLAHVTARANICVTRGLEMVDILKASISIYVWSSRFSEKMVQYNSKSSVTRHLFGKSPSEVCAMGKMDAQNTNALSLPERETGDANVRVEVNASCGLC